MPSEFSNAKPDDPQVLFVVEEHVRQAECLILSCEYCNASGADLPFDSVLAWVTACDPSVIHHVLISPGKCPNCRRDILEKTLVAPV
jgi:hypothetical protein